MYTITQNIEISPDHFLISAKNKDLVKPKPGQFYMLLCSAGTDPLLPRPLSIHGFRADSGESMYILDFLFRVVGLGTTLLSRLRRGDKIQLLGPLGNGFELPEPMEYALFIAGGMGIAPLPFLAEALAEKGGFKSAGLFFGATTAKQIIALERFEKLNFNITLYTEDGSLGKKGYVTDNLDDELEYFKNHRTMVFACGPSEMLAIVAQKCINRKIPCQVSLDKVMACGVGACMGCVVRAANVSSSAPDKIYKRVCKDGPVFQAHEIILSCANRAGEV